MQVSEGAEGGPDLHWEIRIGLCEERLMRISRMVNEEKSPKGKDLHMRSPGGGKEFGIFKE